MPDRPARQRPDPQADAREMVGRANEYWRRAGVPRRRRYEMAEELAGHLHEAAAEGRPLAAVVGDDVEQLAGEWLAAERRRPWLYWTLQLMALALLIPGIFTAFEALRRSEGRVELPATSLLVAVLAVAFNQLFRRRHRLSGRQTALTLVAIVGGYAAGVLLLESLVSEPLSIPPPIGWVALAVGGGLAGLAYWLQVQRRL